MLKLLKHDLKESFLEILIFNAILIGLSLIVLLGITAQIEFLFTFGLIMWTAFFIAVIFIVFRSVIKSFHTKLFTSRGYLTLTTPASIDKILLSKIIINMLWILITVISVIGSILIVIQSMLSSAFNSVSIFNLFFEILWIWASADPLNTVLTIVYFLFDILYFIIMLLFVLVLVNTGSFKKHRTIVGILIYIALSVVVSQILYYINNMHISFAITFVLGAGFYVLSRYLIVNKLELE